MDQRERIGDREEGLRSQIEDFLINTWTAIPGIVQSYNAAQNTVSVQPAIKARIKQVNGSFQWVNLPLLQDVPVVFPGGGNFIATFPIKQGDECIVVFSCRSIDGWWQQGGVQLQTTIRQHDLSDGFAFVGPRSLPAMAAIPNISTTTAQLRTLDGTSFIELAPGGVINIKAAGGVNVTGPLTATGEITAKQGAGNHTVSAHIHGGVTTGAGSTGTPTG